MSSPVTEATTHLRAGRLIGLPTETVYGLAGNALDDHAVATIYAAKSRPNFNPLIVHVADATQAKRYAQWNEAAETLAAAFWPGPLTLVLPRTANCPVSLLASAGLNTIALRAPNHPITQAILRESGLPIAAPSANRSGRVSPTTAAHVQEELGDAVAMVLDGGPCTVGLESTIVSLAGAPTLLRPGAITAEMLAAALGTPLSIYRGNEVHAPGMLASHYAPSLPIRLNVTAPHANEALLAFGPHVPLGAARTLNLSPAGNLTEAAAHLFAYIRELDRPEFSGIAVMPIPQEGLGVAINDRLVRAAVH